MSHGEAVRQGDVTSCARNVGNMSHGKAVRQGQPGRESEK